MERTTYKRRLSDKYIEKAFNDCKSKECWKCRLYGLCKGDKWGKAVKNDERKRNFRRARNH